MGENMKGWVREHTGMPRSVLVLTLNAFFVALGFGVMMPVLPIYAHQFGVGNFEISWVISAFALMRLVTAPFCGTLNSRIGERLALGIGTFLVAASSAAAGMAHSFWELLVYRALGGIGSAMFTVAAMTLLLGSVVPTMRGRASGFYQGGFLIGGMAGPALGGIVAKLGLSAPFFFYSGTLLCGGIACLVLLPRQQRRRVAAGQRPDNAVPLRSVIGDVRYQAALFTAFAQGWQSFGVRSSLIPIIVVYGLHLGPEWTGYTFAVAAVAQTLALSPAGRATDTVGRRPVMVLAGVVTGLSAICMPLAPNIWLLMIILSVYGVGSAMHSTAPTAAVGDATQGRGGTPIALFSMMSDIGAIIGPLVAGWMADKTGLFWPFLVGGCLLLSSAAYSMLMPKDRLEPAIREPEGVVG